MDKKTKELIYMNCESFEFFQMQLVKIEKEYFQLLDDAMESVGDIIELLKKVESCTLDENIIKKMKALKECGDKYVTTSIKFEKETEKMKNLAPCLANSELEFEGVENKFLFVSDYIEELEQTLLLQHKLRSHIEKQLKLFKAFINKHE